MIVRVLLALVTCTTGTSLLGRGAPATTAALVDERAVLKELFTATGGAKWLQSAGWLDDGTGKEHNYYYCTWQGIFCNDQHQVMSIQLASNGLMHGLPSSLYTLPALQTVNLRGNPLTDVGLENATTIASPLTVLDLTDTLIRDVQGVGAAAKTLQVFKLSRSSGNLYDWSSVSMGSSRAAGAGRTFPSVDVTKLTNLHTLHMFDCGYTGTLPLEIGKLTALQELFLQGNELSGSIPDAIGQSCRQLRILSLSDNRWTGTIPLTLCDLANLELLNLQGRGGGGTATSLLSSMSSSSKVGLLTGPLPSLPLATHLRHIFLDYNGLTGSIPETFLQSTDEAKPVTVQLEFNQLTGTIPAVLSRFIALNLQLSGNAFIGPTLPSAFCSASAWMMGAVGQYGCDAILCRSGTFNTDGKQISDNEPCLPCPTMSHSTVTTSATETTAALQLGATDCVSAFTSGDPTAQQERQVRILAEFYLALSGPNEWSNRWTGLDALLADVGLEDGAADSLSSMEDIRVVVDGLNVTSVLSAVCQWYGILCNENGFVEIITLPNNHMVGVIPDTFFQFLPNLKSIDLSNNRIQVADFSALQYASSLSRLRLSNTAVQNLAGLSKAAAHLHELLLDGCNFDGAAISTELYQLTNLLTLHLEASFLAGNIPAEIRQLTNLQRLNLNENNFGGSIPKELASLTYLEYLDLSDNEFEGTIPPELDSMSRLLTLRINSARGGLGGPLPSFVGLSKIEHLELAFNAFTGTIPVNFLRDRQSDGRFKVRLTGNQLEGVIPATLAMFPSLLLEIEENKISGISDALCRNPDWMDGEVGLVSPRPCDAILCQAGWYSPQGRASRKGGNVDCQTCEGNLYFGETVCETKGLQSNSEVEILDLLFSETGGRYWKITHANWTKPGVPICYREGVLCGWHPPDMNSGVTELRLNDFGLRGHIPTEIFQLPKIRRIAFSSNPIDMSFKGIEQAQLLEIVALSHTSISSLAGIEKAREMLHDLNVATSFLTGSFPTELFKLSNLKALNLGDNRLTGEIPTQIKRMSSLEQVTLDNNGFSGTLPTELGALLQLKLLDVSDNRFSGALPSELENLVNLERINFSGQRSESRLTGPLLPFSSNQNLHNVNASLNAFAGTVPANMLSSVDKEAATQLDLSYNKLTGKFPVEFAAFKLLNINLAANEIDELPSAVCFNLDWMNGVVRLAAAGHKCDAILCKPGTFTLNGRQMHKSEPCEKCASSAQAPYYGSTACSDPTSKHDREVLIELAAQTSIDKWFNNENWLSARHVCSWFGVHCNPHNYVTKLSLEDNGLKQSLNSGFDVIELLSSLSNLKDLILDNNDLKVDFRRISAGTSIVSLNLSNSGLLTLEGISRAKRLSTLVAIGNHGLVRLPKELFRMSSLKQLFLSDNKLTGSLPVALFLMSNLEYLSLPDNEFQGTIPSQVGSMTKLRELVLSGNNLSGTIPTEINKIETLERLALAAQKGSEPIKGNLPDFASALNLWYVDVSHNALSGELSETLLKGTKDTAQYISIYMDNNGITGTIPLSLRRFSRLDLRLKDNRIEGIPPALCSQSNWLNGAVGIVGSCDAILCPQGYFAVDGRQLTIEHPCLRCESLLVSPFLGQTSCSDISERNILQDLFSAAGGTKWLHGDHWNSNMPICGWYGIECGGTAQDDNGVTAVQLESNNMIGTLSASVWLLPSLIEVDLSGNSELHVSFESITRSIPFVENINVASTIIRSMDGVSHALNLRRLVVSGITGVFPSEIFNLAQTLELLDLSKSLLIGTVPSRIGELTKLTRFLASGNDFHGAIPKEIKKLSNLQELDLSENLLSGLLPSDELSSLSGLQHFSVSRRTKSGRKIPGPLPPFNELPALLVLALDDNSFSGPIPVDFIAASMHVQSVDISRNRLSGLVPPNLSSVPGVKMDFLENDWNVLTDAVPGTLSKANERGILVDLFKTSGGNLWLRNDFWNSNVDFCSWNGVGCNEGRVILINLQSNNLVGTLPRQIFDLPLLQMLWLSENPKFEVKFENLRNVSNLLDLKVDGTSTKSLKGIRNAKSLTYLDASNNKLAGNFPNELFALENLRLLSLSNNSFYGALPESLSSFRYLRVFEAESNSFTGWLPSFSDSIALSKVNLGYNDLKGKIPRDFLDRVPNFTSLNISLQGNKLTGSIPQEFQRFAIVNININGNQIDTIPSVLCDRSGWNDGAVGKYGCNGLACAPGTTNLAGRQSFEFPVCVKCPAAAPFFGQVNCVGTMRSSSATYSTGSLIPWVMLLLASGFSLF